MRKLLVLLLLLFPTLSFAAEEEKPRELAPFIRADAPIGTATLHRFFFTVYDASLWTDAQRWSEKSTYALSLRYHISCKSKDIVEKSIEEMDNQKPLTEEEKARYAAQLAKVIPPMKDEDTITALYVPRNSLIFYHNGEFAGKITNMKLANRFMDIWLSSETSEPSLRRKLLNL